EADYARNLTLAEAYANARLYQKAADTLIAIPAGQNRATRNSIETAARLLRNAPRAPDTLPVLDDETNFVYAHIGALEHVLDFFERARAAGGNPAFVPLWDPNYAPLRKTERFKTIMRNAGMVDYWRAKGWPDLCKPVGADDFACE